LYTLGLGKLSTSLRKERRVQDSDKLIYVRREEERLNKSLRLVNKSSQAIYERMTYAKSGYSETIKRLLRGSRVLKTCTKSN